MAGDDADLLTLLRGHIKKNDSDHSVFFKKMKACDDAIRGNGKPGLRSEVEGHGHRISNVEIVVDEIKKMRQWFMFGALGIIAMAILQLLGWVGTVR